MNAARTKASTGWAGSANENARNSGYNNNLPENLHIINQSIAKARTRLHLTNEEWRNFSIFSARLALDSAPDDVRVLFAGKPSETPKNASFLAEVFTTLVIQAEDMATATNVSYSYTDLWAQAMGITGGVQ